ncbi:MAG TPA: HlyC/CorC family transporter [Candidatus Merdenecus merdavium]|nr:HlyC/CorC family transporter [Candidatus Merdenecus merdavium]
MDEGGKSSIAFAVFIIFVIVEALFYSFGTAVQLINRKDLEKEIEGKDKKTQLLLQLKDEPNGLISTIQVLSTFISFMLGHIQVPVFTSSLAKAVIKLPRIKTLDFIFIYNICRIFVIVILLIIIVDFGIFIPKKIASKRSTKWAYSQVNFVYVMTIMLKPFTYVIGAIANGILKMFGMSSDDNLEDVTEEEIISIVNEGHERGVLLESEAEMIQNIMEFSNTQAEDIMNHRKNIVGIEIHQTIEFAVDFVINSIYSRFPVYDETIDNIVGIIYLKDLMKSFMTQDNKGKTLEEIQGLIRPAIYIPESRKIDLLFQTMRAEKVQMIVAIDEYGQTSGIISMEDIIEEIVGNIFDEYDEVENYIIPIGEKIYIMDGLTPLEDVEDTLNISIDDDEFGILNGYLISILDRIPSEDERCEVVEDGVVYKILSVKGNMIQKVRVEKLEEKVYSKLENQD